VAEIRGRTAALARKPSGDGEDTREVAELYLMCCSFNSVARLAVIIPESRQACTTRDRESSANGIEKSLNSLRSLSSRKSIVEGDEQGQREKERLEQPRREQMI
jgi:hypothetical protein